MNTGIGDAINLAWELAAVVRGHAPDRLLDSYEVERIGFARRLVATTDRVFSFVTAEGRIADIIRTRVAPVLIPTAMTFEAAREFLFRTVSQITLNYRGGPLSAGAVKDVTVAGAVDRHLGADREPALLALEDNASDPAVFFDNRRRRPGMQYEMHAGLDNQFLAQQL